eukprot:TRINITY_DN68160_c0_g1_i1.p1 TRINITY_DN68160_c0_g1~~TRINITY_DN68160_c0_g1_i1.p1  ORF type:complete len:1534 (-),score=120.98 TRINITY_DN68160_c0_g1_i1:946-5547(-)
MYASSDDTSGGLSCPNFLVLCDPSPAFTVQPRVSRSRVNVVSVETRDGTVNVPFDEVSVVHSARSGAMPPTFSPSMSTVVAKICGAPLEHIIQRVLRGHASVVDVLTTASGNDETNVFSRGLPSLFGFGDETSCRSLPVEAAKIVSTAAKSAGVETQLSLSAAVLVALPGAAHPCWAIDLLTSEVNAQWAPVLAPMAAALSLVSVEPSLLHRTSTRAVAQAAVSAAPLLPLTERWFTSFAALSDTYAKVASRVPTALACSAEAVSSARAADFPDVSASRAVSEVVGHTFTLSDAASGVAAGAALYIRIGVVQGFPSGAIHPKPTTSQGPGAQSPFPKRPFVEPSRLNGVSALQPEARVAMSSLVFVLRSPATCDSVSTVVRECLLPSLSQETDSSDPKHTRNDLHDFLQRRLQPLGPGLRILVFAPTAAAVRVPAALAPYLALMKAATNRAQILVPYQHDSSVLVVEAHELLAVLEGIVVHACSREGAVGSHPLQANMRPAWAAAAAGFAAAVRSVLAAVVETDAVAALDGAVYEGRNGHRAHSGPSSHLSGPLPRSPLASKPQPPCDDLCQPPRPPRPFSPSRSLSESLLGPFPPPHEGSTARSDLDRIRVATEHPEVNQSSAVFERWARAARSGLPSEDVKSPQAAEGCPHASENTPTDETDAPLLVATCSDVFVGRHIRGGPLAAFALQGCPHQPRRAAIRLCSQGLGPDTVVTHADNRQGSSHARAPSSATGRADPRSPPSRQSREKDPPASIDRPQPLRGAEAAMPSDTTAVSIRAAVGPVCVGLAGPVSISIGGQLVPLADVLQVALTHWADLGPALHRIPSPPRKTCDVPRASCLDSPSSAATDAPVAFARAAELDRALQSALIALAAARRSANEASADKASTARALAATEESFKQAAADHAALASHAHAEIAALKSRLQTAEHSLSQAQATLTTNAIQVTSLQSRLAAEQVATRAAADRHLAAIEDATSLAEEYSSRLATTTSSWQTAEANANTLREELRDACAVQTALKKSLDDALVSMTQMNQHSRDAVVAERATCSLAAAREELVTHRTRIETLETALRTSQAAAEIAVSRAEEETAACAAARAAAETASLDRSSTIREFTARLISLREETEAARAAAADATAAVEKMRGERDLAKADVATLRSETAHAVEDAMAARRERDAVLAEQHRALAAASEAVEALRRRTAEADASAAAAAAAEEVASAERDARNAQSAELLKVRTSLAASINDCSNAANAISVAVSERDAAHAAATEALEMVTSERARTATMDAEYKDLTQRMKSLCSAADEASGSNITSFHVVHFETLTRGGIVAAESEVRSLIVELSQVHAQALDSRLLTSRLEGETCALRVRLQREIEAGVLLVRTSERRARNAADAGAQAAAAATAAVASVHDSLRRPSSSRDHVCRMQSSGAPATCPPNNNRDFRPCDAENGISVPLNYVPGDKVVIDADETSSRCNENIPDGMDTGFGVIAAPEIGTIQHRTSEAPPPGRRRSSNGTPRPPARSPSPLGNTPAATRTEPH